MGYVRDKIRRSKARRNPRRRAGIGRTGPLAGHPSPTSQTWHSQQGYHPRIFVAWEPGGYLTSELSNFQQELLDMVQKWGPPTVVEFRTSYPRGNPPKASSRRAKKR